MLRVKTPLLSLTLVSAVFFAGVQALGMPAAIAQADTTSTEQQIASIQQQIQSLQTEYSTASANVERSASDLTQQQSKVADQSATYLALQARQETADQQASQAKRRAGAIVARFARNGQATDLNLAFDSSDAAGTLTRLSSLGRIGQQAAGVYKDAVHELNEARQLTKQARQAQNALQQQMSALTAAANAAQSAQDSLQKSLRDQQNNAVQLASELATLQHQDAAAAAAAAAAQVQQRQAAAQSQQQSAVQRVQALARDSSNQYAQRAQQSTSSGRTSPSSGSSASSGSNTTGASRATASSSSGTGSSSVPSGAGIVSTALMLANKNIPYDWGGTTLSGFDCSGFVQYVFSLNGIRLPRTSQAQTVAGTQISVSQARAGDLVSWGYHIGIYLGNGQMVDAPRPGKTVGIHYIKYYGGSPVYVRI
ncbi:MAG: C40 family peptidase [Microbacteriaceae bacterium]|nr:C40 family peptidase [Microbacteriaceae bacterium]MCI1207127.1 C40 family peptidase [Microbacteriaceae bacterium]